MKPNKNQNTQYVRGYSRNGITSRARALLFLAVLAIMSFDSQNAKAQSSSQEIIYKQWYFLAESSNHVDISGQIIRCSATSPAQLHLFIFNEGSESNNIEFNVVITDNATGLNFTTAIQHTVNRADMIRANCDDTALNNLKITLPAGYNPENISVAVNFN